MTNAMTPEQARKANLAIKFLPANPDDDPKDPDTVPGLQLPNGGAVFVYYDERGVLTVTVEAQEDPIRVHVGDTVGERSVVFEDIPDLPGWDDLTDLDKGIALAHAYKAQHEGPEYATEFYAPMYADERLEHLSAETRSAHARQTVGETFGDMLAAEKELGAEEYQRLTDLAYKSGKA